MLGALTCPFFLPVTSVLIISSDPGAPPLAADFAAAGFQVFGPFASPELVREALRASPDVVTCWQPRADPALLEALRALQAQQPVPVAVFTLDASVEWMQQALDAGVHAWSVQAYAPGRLRPLMQLAQARQARERGLLEAVADLTARLEERKLIDKAKGILMRARQVSEGEAFQLLRTASMHGNQRVGQVSQQVIDAAMVAEAVNRAGQQRMLSQRLVKLYALACSATDGAAAALLMRQSKARVEENLDKLGKTLSAATFGDLLEAARLAWQPLHALLDAPPNARRLQELDALAEQLLARSEALVAALEGSGLASTVRVINVSGRQRMLAQRLAKQALLAALSLPAQPEASAQARAQFAETEHAFDEGMATLADAPLASAQIRESLAATRGEWDALREGAAVAGTHAGRMRLASASEALLTQFDRLTDAYQHSLQVLMG